MRPRIPEELAAQVEAVYEDAGYSTPTEFIRDAVRHRAAHVAAASELSNDIEGVTISPDDLIVSDGGDSAE